MINILSELAHKNRFEIYKLLIRKGDNGLTIGEISKLLAIPLSTLSFHLNGLKDADLITQKKIVRNVYCYAQIDLLTDVLEKLKSDYTIIVISHRTEILKFCNKVLKLQNGSLSNNSNKIQ